MSIEHSESQRPWLTVKEAAGFIGVCTNTMLKYTRLRKGKPPFYRFTKNGRLRFPREEFIKWSRGETDK